MIVCGIDPGPVETAYVVYNSRSMTLEDFAYIPNDELLEYLRVLHAVRTVKQYESYAVEMIASYGMPVGAEVFETCVMIGRLIEAVQPIPVHRVYRKNVKLNLCGSMRAKDANVRQALIDMFGGKDRAIGRKASPGPLYGVKGDVWSALGVAVTHVAESVSVNQTKGGHNGSTPN